MIRLHVSFRENAFCCDDTITINFYFFKIMHFKHVHSFLFSNIIMSFFSVLQKQINSKDQQLANTEDQLQKTNAENAALSKKF